MEPCVEASKQVIENITRDLAGREGQRVKNAVQFGLVEYRDTEDRFVSRVTLPLNPDPNKLYETLKTLDCDGGGTYPRR